MRTQEFMESFLPVEPVVPAAQVLEHPAIDASAPWHEARIFTPVTRFIIRTVGVERTVRTAREVVEDRLAKTVAVADNPNAAGNDIEAKRLAAGARKQRQTGADIAKKAGVDASKLPQYEPNKSHKGRKVAMCLLAVLAMPKAASATYKYLDTASGPLPEHAAMLPELEQIEQPTTTLPQVDETTTTTVVLTPVTEAPTTTLLTTTVPPKPEIEPAPTVTVPQFNQRTFGKVYTSIIDTDFFQKVVEVEKKQGRDYDDSLLAQTIAAYNGYKLAQDVQTGNVMNYKVCPSNGALVLAGDTVQMFANRYGVTKEQVIKENNGFQAIAGYCAVVPETGVQE